MSLHIEANKGEIAKTILITGDPLRARHYAEAWFENPICYNRIRGMYGYTGMYQGKTISIQGTGMGMPSTALYLHELIHDYQVECIIRVETCGAIQRNIKLGQVILAAEAGTDSSVVRQYLPPSVRNSEADASLITLAKEMAQAEKVSIITGSVFSTDLFYCEDPHRFEPIINDGVLAVDMETIVLYAMASYFNIRSISLLTVSDTLFTGVALSAKALETQTADMVKLAFKIASTS
jgi:purine-nucleoside phosphorylase